MRRPWARPTLLDGSSRVRIETRWYTDGVRGLVERVVAPRVLRRVYREELRLLDRYAAETTRPSRLEPAPQRT